MPNSQVLGEKVAKQLKLPLSKLKFTRFADGEVLLSAEETVRNKEVYIVASVSTPVNDNLMQLLIFVDSLKRASASKITVAITYYGYARQDRKAAGRQPIGAKLVADLLEKSGVHKVIAVDLHNPSIQGFFDIPLDDLKGQYIFAPEIKKAGKFTVASPDHGGAVRARVLANLISNTVQIAIVDKRRTGANQSEVMHILGDVKDKNVVIIDDMIDTGGTIIKAAEALKNAGALKIIVAASHGIFSKGFDAFENAPHIDQVLITDSIESVYSIKSKKLKVVSLAPILVKAINASVDGLSIGEYYEQIKGKM
uniref:Ribose-phosphate pyrophosphokinase n=1 Tax=Biomphalaria glabrata TaxID=6526 RepID=A0A2C9KXD2_BIOGL